MIDDMQDTDHDAESLFGGSPPPSPIMRGRSPSPALALPGSTSSVGIMNSTQNVGTIALPGSQFDIELPTTPIALPLRISHWPTAQVASFSVRNPSMIPATSSSGSSRESSVVSSSSRPKVSQKVSRKRKASTLYERPPPPEIPLPDPSAPIPSNFLRSQTALLGTAGLVAGLKPVNISHRDARGTSSNNPIVLEDDAPPTPPIHPALPPPSNQEIVRELIQEKEVLHLLHELLTLVAKGGLPQPDSHVRKKKKTGHIPAGAGEWDVNQSPETQMARCKYLVSELMGHIRTATRKAAIKTYWQQGLLTHYIPKNHYRTRTSTPQPPAPPDPAPLCVSNPPPNTTLSSDTNKENELFPASQMASAVDDFSSMCTSTTTKDSTSPSDTTQSATLDQLLGSLLHVSSKDVAPSLDAALANPTLPVPPPDIEQWLLDSWMPIFESFPTSTNGVTGNDGGELALPSDFAMDVDFGLLDAPGEVTDVTQGWDDFGSTSFVPVTSPFDDPLLPPSTEPPDGHQLAPEHTPCFVFQDNGDDFNPENLQRQPPSDAVIDPLLLAESCATPFPQKANTSDYLQPPPSVDFDMGPPSLVGSPMPSMSSFGDDLLTPNSSGWEVTLPPEVASAPNPANTEGGIVGEGSQDVLELARAAEKNANMQEVLPALISALFPKGAKQVKVAKPAVAEVVSRQKLGKADILKEAHARRQQLADAIVQARTKLWETTIEQGVLSHLAHYYKTS